MGKAHESIPIGLWVSHSVANKITLHMYEHVNKSKAGSLLICARSIAESKRTKERKERHVLKLFFKPIFNLMQAHILNPEIAATCKMGMQYV